MSSFANLIPYLSLLERILPSPVLDHAVRDLGYVLSRFQRQRKRVVKENIRRLGIESTVGIPERTIVNWTISLSDQLKSLWISKEKLLRMVEDQASINLNNALNVGRGVILVTAHLGNYELGGSWLAALGFPVHAVVEEIGGGHSEAMMRVRKRFGMAVIKESDVQGMIRVLRKGEILVLLGDRDLGRGGRIMPFGKGTRRIPVGPALLALRTGAVVQTGYFVLVDGTRGYRCLINPHLKLPPPGGLEARMEALAKRIVDELEAAIALYPDQWFVFQDEWEKLDEAQ